MKTNTVTQRYALTGLTSVILIDEKSMADALGLSRPALRAAIEGGKYGLAFHGNPLNTPEEEYTFLSSIFENNIKIWKCVQSGGHYLQFAGYYDDRLKKSKNVCQCGYTDYD